MSVCPQVGDDATWKLAGDGTTMEFPNQSNAACVGKGPLSCDAFTGVRIPMSRIQIQLFSKQRNTYLIQLATDEYSQIHTTRLQPHSQQPHPNRPLQNRRFTKMAYSILGFLQASDAKATSCSYPPTLYVPSTHRDGIFQPPLLPSRVPTSARRYITKRYKQNPHRSHMWVARLLPLESHSVQVPVNSHRPLLSFPLSPGLGILCM